MTKRILALLLALALSLSLAACGGGSSPASSGTDASAADSSTAGEGSAPETGSASQYPGLTDQEQEAVDAGLLRLDGSVPIITDPDAFEDKYGKITMFVHYTGGRTRGVEELEIIKQLEDLTGIRFEWDDVPLDGVAEKINLMLSSGSDLPDAFWNFQDGLSGTFAVQYADQEVFILCLLRI